MISMVKSFGGNEYLKNVPSKYLERLNNLSDSEINKLLKKFYKSGNDLKKSSVSEDENKEDEKFGL